MKPLAAAVYPAALFLDRAQFLAQNGGYEDGLIQDQPVQLPGSDQSSRPSEGRQMGGGTYRRVREEAIGSAWRTPSPRVAVLAAKPGLAGLLCAQASTQGSDRPAGGSIRSYLRQNVGKINQFRWNFQKIRGRGDDGRDALVFRTGSKIRGL